MKYLLDSNIFINAKRIHYGFDFCPGFWDWIELKNKSGIIFSIEKVYDEITSSDDNLSDWAKKKGNALFLKPDDDLYFSFEPISSWLYSKTYRQTAINDFLSSADHYLVAHALAKGYVVVSNEVPSGKSKSVKIPDVCNGVGVKCIKTHELLRMENARFILDKGEKP